MSSYEKFAAEQEALRSLLDLTVQANKCRELYERANMQLPEPLARFLGIGEVIGPKMEPPPPSGRKRVVPGRPLPDLVPPPESPERPNGIPEDWISVPARSASTQTLLLAVLRAAESPIQPADALPLVRQFVSVATLTSLSNTAARLGGLVDRSGGGWRLTDPTKAAVLANGDAYLWGPAAIFTVQEIAAYRREGIVHLLRVLGRSMQGSEIREYLSQSEWLRAPASKSLVQEDLYYMLTHGIVGREEETKFWFLKENSAGKETAHPLPSEPSIH